MSDLLATLTLDGVCCFNGLNSILQGLEVREGVDVVWLQDSLLVPLIPGSDEVEVLVDAPRGVVAHVAERLHQASLELLRACSVSRRAATHPVVKASSGAPVLRPGGHKVLVFSGRWSAATLANRHEVEAGIKQGWHERGAPCSADRTEEVDASKAVLLCQRVPAVHHRGKFVANLLWEVDGEDRLVVHLLVLAVLEVRQEVLKMLFPTSLVRIVLVDQDLTRGVLSVAAFPSPVGPGEEEGDVRLSVLQHQVRDLPHDAAVLHVLSIEPVMVEHEAVNAELACKICLALAHLAIGEIIIIQASLLRRERLAQLVRLVHERLQVGPLCESFAMELIILRKLVVLWEVDSHDLRSHGKLANEATGAAECGDREVSQLHLHTFQLWPDSWNGRCQAREGRGTVAGPEHVASNRSQLILRDVDVGVDGFQKLLRGLFGRPHVGAAHLGT